MIKRYSTRHAVLFGLLAALLAASIPAWAQAPVLHNEAAAGPNAGTTAPLPVMPQGIIYGINAPVVGIAGTGEQTLGTWSMPANTLDVVGRRLRITASFTTAANTNNKTPKLYVGSEALATAAIATSAQPAFIQLYVLKTGASTQVVYGIGIGGNAGVTPVNYSTTGAETDTAAIVIKATCTGGTTGADCTLNDMVVEELN